MAAALLEGKRGVGRRGKGMWLGYAPVHPLRSNAERTGYAVHADGEYSPSAGCRR
jgi:hypothetical protein